MSKNPAALLEPGGAVPELLEFDATDVTGTHALSASGVEPSLTAGTVAAALASRMSLPADVAWALRDDRTSMFLDDGTAIGDQIETGTTLTVTPKTHLG